MKAPGQGIETDKTLPISAAAHREPSFFANYAKELFRREPSGIAREAADILSSNYGNLSGVVHAAALTASRGLLPPIAAPSQSQLAAFMKMFKMVAGASCLVLGASFRPRFERLPAMHRAWFDWLVGDQLKKRVRSQQFGLAAP